MQLPITVEQSHAERAAALRLASPCRQRCTSCIVALAIMEALGIEELGDVLVTREVISIRATRLALDRDWVDDWFEIPTPAILQVVIFWFDRLDRPGQPAPPLPVRVTLELPDADTKRSPCSISA